MSSGSSERIWAPSGAEDRCARLGGAPVDANAEGVSRGEGR